MHFFERSTPEEINVLEGSYNLRYHFLLFSIILTFFARVIKNLQFKPHNVTTIINS